MISDASLAGLLGNLLTAYKLLVVQGKTCFQMFPVCKCKRTLHCHGKDMGSIAIQDYNKDQYCIWKSSTPQSWKCGVCTLGKFGFARYQYYNARV